MKSCWKAACVAAAFVIPAISLAQGSGAPSRAQVRADLVRYERAGFNPARQNPSRRVDDLQAASVRVQAEDGVATASNTAAQVATMTN
ncbi:DUF4148 domain-containing protein [Burkholderia plantarii]|uniref:DUF4148 domain-containing protein n=1 Tax=Burkholderia plantarii TaxID=41899 RepID=A0A0B6S245_BURPL|nr:DUF4148 domain-containing protein [Burkholderia plantarii]AJK48464.1 hypothetical protein BGL_2c03730 [Burkholderia plantarii]